MKVNMKKNRLYAAMAAVVLLAAGCTDKIGDGTELENPEELNGQKCYLTVNIATGTSGGFTKAGSSNGEGDQYLEEIKGLKEDEINDVNIFLFEVPASITENDKLLKTLNADLTTDIDIAGHGYVGNLNETPNGGSEAYHDKADVVVTLKDPLGDNESKTYQVLTIVNAGSSLTNYTKLSQLRDATFDKAWTGGASDLASYTNFVMSTHQMKGNTAESTVELSKNNTSEGNPAHTTVYVERLAARVDLKVAENLSSSSRTDGTFAVTRYLPVNLWTGNTYMFKQVSPSVTSWTGAIPAVDAVYSDGEYKYLGDEIWNNTGNGTGTFNYVLDPQTRTKTATQTDNFNNNNFSYTNHFISNTTTLDPTNGAWKDVSVLTGSQYTSGDFTPILYTRENTTAYDQQKNGFSTGVIFESTFTPGEGFGVSLYSDGVISSGRTNLPQDKSFFVANHLGTDGHHVKVNYADVKTIAAMAFVNIEDMSKPLYEGFMDGSWLSNGPDLTTLESIVDKMQESNPVEAAFKAYLKGVFDGADESTFDDIKGLLNYNSFVADAKYSNLTQDDQSDQAYAGILYENYEVSYYLGGKSYYKFWIRHDDNQNPNLMSVMEFAIVRNNVYQLSVTGVRDLGDPLPFTPGKDDPNNPDESDELKISVEIYVKNWVNRLNDNIIL
ncbi:hypothetical protein GCM10007084_48680 [Parabacteroides faecis]|nr:hypothetical protein GCM10007084_48680 [Parabacteroides faecis]